MNTTRARWLTLTAALLGWMFDGMEMGLFPLVAKDALTELLQVPKDHELVKKWFGIILASFLIGAATGGVIFGWLGDKIGRVRAMTISVLLYSLASGLSALSEEPWQLAALRFLGALGMGGEWALGVALVMEAWAEKSRAWLAGWIGAFGNLGYTLCALISLGLNHSDGHVHATLQAIGLTPQTVTNLTQGNYWRLLMLFGAGPAMLTLLLRLFVPESERWKQASGKTSHWSSLDMFSVLCGSFSAIIMVVVWTYDLARWVQIGATVLGLAGVIYGFLAPVRGYLTRTEASAGFRKLVLDRMLLAAGLSSVALLGTWSAVMWMYQWVRELPGGNAPDAGPWIQFSSSIGAALGCLMGAGLGGLLNRRFAYALLCVSSAAAIVSFYQFNTEYNRTFILSAGAMGFFTASFYGWLPLYLPELFPTAVRASGQGFGFNFGRILAAVGSLLMPMLLAAFGGNYANACAIVPIVYMIGLIIIYYAPETKGRPLPD